MILPQVSLRLLVQNHSLPSNSPANMKILTAQLRAMEESGLVHREVYADVPPRVEYSLTDPGQGLKPIPDSMTVWGEGYKKQFGKSCEACFSVGNQGGPEHTLRPSLIFGYFSTGGVLFRITPPRGDSSPRRRSGGRDPRDRPRYPRW